jgi:hypothetical protein
LPAHSWNASTPSMTVVIAVLLAGQDRFCPGTLVAQATSLR